MFTICEKDEDMSIDDMMKRIERFTKGYGVAWKKKIEQKYFHQKMNTGLRFSVQTKPDPVKDKDCALITFNNATKSMMSQPGVYFEANFKDKWPCRITWKKSYKDSWYHGREPMLMYIYSRKISNRSPFRPFSPWNTFHFPKMSCSKAEDLLSVVQSFKPEEKVRVDFSYDTSTNRFKVKVPLTTCLRMDPIISDILGFKQREYFLGNEFTAEYTPALDRSIDNLFIYSDITEAVFVGNVKTPLLCIIPYDKKTTSPGSSSHTIQNPTYVPLMRQSFNQQRIVILDEAGIRVPFDQGKTVLLLHFRKRI